VKEERRRRKRENEGNMRESQVLKGILQDLIKDPRKRLQEKENLLR